MDNGKIIFILRENVKLIQYAREIPIIGTDLPGIVESSWIHQNDGPITGIGDKWQEFRPEIPLILPGLDVISLDNESITYH